MRVFNTTKYSHYNYNYNSSNYNAQLKRSHVFCCTSNKNDKTAGDKSSDETQVQNKYL